MVRTRAEQLARSEAVVRRQIATHVLNGMLASSPMCDRTKVDVKKWVKKAYEFTDELIRQGEKKR
jgi:hypothetical protein